MKPKLVRDHIPDIIEETGSICVVSYVDDFKHHTIQLRNKMTEEIEEFIDNPSYSEAADVVEVIKTLCQMNGLEWESVLSAAVDKNETHGGFLRGVILESVDYRI